MNREIHTVDRLAANEAEAAVLGAVILDSSILGWLTLTDEHFNFPMHLTIFRAMTKLYVTDTPIDEVTLWDELVANSSAGGVSLPDISRLAIKVPTADNAEYWADILEEHRRLRVLQRSVAEATKRLSGSGTGNSGEIQDELLSDLAELAASGKSAEITMEQAADEELARLEAQWAGGGAIARTKTGIHALDLYTGGVPIGVLSALGARPGVGKSTMLWNICYNLAHRGEDVLVLTNEDRPNVSARLGIANETGIERIRLLTGEKITEEEKHRIRESVESMRAANSRYHTLRIHGKKMKEICREATALIRRYGIKFAALDYIQNVQQPESGLSRTYGIEANLTDLEAMVADEDISFPIVGQIKRIEDTRRPQMDDFKDSGSIEQKCKLMMILSDGENQTMDIDVVKNSEGRMGGTVSVQVDKGLGRIF